MSATDAENMQNANAEPPLDSAAAAAPEDERAALQRQVQELKDQHLRLIAEMRNVQQRAQRDKQEALRFAHTDLARELLDPLDGLERTCASSKTAGDVAGVAAGLQIVLEQFHAALRKFGVTPIAAVDQTFDPDVHEAVMMQASGERPAGVVLEELARGYRIHDRVLRTSKVIVAKASE